MSPTCPAVSPACPRAQQSWRIGLINAFAQCQGGMCRTRRLSQQCHRRQVGISATAQLRDMTRICSTNMSAFVIHNPGKSISHPLVEVVTAELHSRVGHDSNAIRSVAAHKPSPSLLPPHLSQCLPNRQLVCISSSTLYLHQDLQSLEGRDHGSGHGAGYTAGAEGGNDGLRYPFAGSNKGFWVKAGSFNNSWLGLRI